MFMGKGIFHITTVDCVIINNSKGKIGVLLADLHN